MGGEGAGGGAGDRSVDGTGRHKRRGDARRFAGASSSAPVRHRPPAVPAGRGCTGPSHGHADGCSCRPRCGLCRAQFGHLCRVLGAAHGRRALRGGRALLGRHRVTAVRTALREGIAWLSSCMHNGSAILAAAELHPADRAPPHPPAVLAGLVGARLRDVALRPVPTPTPAPTPIPALPPSTLTSATDARAAGIVHLQAKLSRLTAPLPLQPRVGAGRGTSARRHQPPRQAGAMEVRAGCGPSTRSSASSHRPRSRAACPSTSAQPWAARHSMTRSRPTGCPLVHGRGWHCRRRRWPSTTSGTSSPTSTRQRPVGRLVSACLAA